MKSPVLHELNISDYSYMALKKAFNDNQVGSLPTYFTLNIEKDELIERALESIDKVLKDEGINPRFPFPLYIICPKRAKYNNLNIIQNKTQLPEHFKKKAQKLKAKEMGLLNKTEISANRIKNQNINDKMNLIKELADGQRLLSELTREAHFYQKVLKKIKDKDDKKILI